MPLKPTTDHAEIMRWAASGNASPVEAVAHVHDGEPAILRFIFGAVPKDQSELRSISWESFFAQFDLMGLALVIDGPRQYELVQIEEKSAYRFQGRPM